MFCSRTWRTVKGTHQRCEVESLKHKLISHSSESLFDTNYSRPASRRSCGHSTSEMHNYSSTYRGMGDKLQSGIKAQRACDPYMNQEKRGMCFDQLHMPKGKELPCEYRRIGAKQEPGLAAQQASDSRFWDRKELWLAWDGC